MHARWTDFIFEISHHRRLPRLNYWKFGVDILLIKAFANIFGFTTDKINSTQSPPLKMYDPKK